MSEIKICPICKIRPVCSDHFLARYCTQCPRNKARLNSKVYSCNRRAQKDGAEGTFTIDEWKTLCDKFDKRCVHCKRPGDYHSLTPDHVVSMSVGGSNYIDNIQPVCSSCNSSKGNRTIDYRPSYDSSAEPSRFNREPLL